MIPNFVHHGALKSLRLGIRYARGLISNVSVVKSVLVSNYVFKYEDGPSEHLSYCLLSPRFYSFNRDYQGDGAKRRGNDDDNNNRTKMRIMVPCA